MHILYIGLSALLCSYCFCQHSDCQLTLFSMPWLSTSFRKLSKLAKKNNVSFHLSSPLSFQWNRNNLCSYTCVILLLIIRRYSIFICDLPVQTFHLFFGRNYYSNWRLTQLLPFMDRLLCLDFYLCEFTLVYFMLLDLSSASLRMIYVLILKNTPLLN